MRQAAGGGLGQALGERNKKGKVNLFGIFLVEPCEQPWICPPKCTSSADKGCPALSPAMLCGCRNDCQVSAPGEQEKEFCFSV